MTDYEELVKALRCKSLSKKCDSCVYGYHLCPDSECNDACRVEQIYSDAAAAIEDLKARLGEAENSVERWKDMYLTKHEPKRGEWINHKDEHQCSVCRETVVVDEIRWEQIGAYDYCPNCGAKMIGE